MVYVVANDGQPLMPTERHGKVCRMLKSGMAKVIKKCPFTIQLQSDTMAGNTSFSEDEKLDFLISGHYPERK